MNMLEDLEAVVRLRDAAEYAAVALSSEEFAEADKAYSDKAAIYIATHHAAIRDMAARLEAAERDAALLALAIHHAEKSTHAHGITFSIHFEPMPVSNGSLREYLEAMQEAGR
ncbi:MAG TPA: hypothetical protein VFQ32_09120 [Ktedonobacterales bacterium]|nr:hypothetical protein [Ktedonobacterales bacterium]